MVCNNRSFAPVNHEHLWATRRMLSESDPETPRTERLGQQRGTHIWKRESFLGVNSVSLTSEPDGRPPAPTRSFLRMSRARTRQLTSQAQARGNT